MESKQSEHERQTLDWIIACSKKAPGGLEDITCHNMVRMVRVRLGMTQAQLAERVGLPQSHIAKIEGGGVDIQISTMKRIFRALHCEPVMLPRPVQEIEKILEQRAERVAKRIAGRAGKSGERARKISEIKRKLMEKPSSALWED